MGAEWDAAYSSIDARTLVLAVGLEAFSILVDFGVIFTWPPLGLGCRGTKSEEGS